MILIFVIAGGFAIDLLAFVWSGYVLSILWAWHVMPLFGLPAISVTQAVGLAVVFGLLTHQSSIQEDDAGMLFVRVTFFNFCYPLLALFVGWLVA